MANEVMLQAEINKGNWQQVISNLYETRLIAVSNKDVSEQKLLEIYNAYVADYHEIPELADICDEVLFYNSSVLMDVANILMEFDEYSKSIKAEISSQMQRGEARHFGNLEEDVKEEVRELLISDLFTELSGEGDNPDRDYIGKTLTALQCMYYLDYDDELYIEYDFLAKAGDIIVVNDAQLLLFPEKEERLMRDFYAKKGILADVLGPYSVVAFDKTERSNVAQLEFKGGW